MLRSSSRAHAPAVPSEPKVLPPETGAVSVAALPPAPWTWLLLGSSFSLAVLAVLVYLVVSLRRAERRIAEMQKALKNHSRELRELRQSQWLAASSDASADETEGAAGSEAQPCARLPSRRTEPSEAELCARLPLRRKERVPSTAAPKKEPAVAGRSPGRRAAEPCDLPGPEDRLQESPEPDRRWRSGASLSFQSTRLEPHQEVWQPRRTVSDDPASGTRGGSESAMDTGSVSPDEAFRLLHALKSNLRRESSESDGLPPARGLPPAKRASSSAEMASSSAGAMMAAGVDARVSSTSPTPERSQRGMRQRRDLYRHLSSPDMSEHVRANCPRVRTVSGSPDPPVVSPYHAVRRLVEVDQMRSREEKVAKMRRYQQEAGGRTSPARTTSSPARR